MSRLLLALSRTTLILSLTLSGIAAVSGTLAYAGVTPAPCDFLVPTCFPITFDKDGHFKSCNGRCVGLCECTESHSEDKDGNTTYYCDCRFK